jgi:GNAT superfamily N-acetyltransferase
MPLAAYRPQAWSTPAGPGAMALRGEPEGPSGSTDNLVRIRAADPDDSGFLALAILNASRSHLSRGLWDLVVAGSEEVRLDFLELMTLMEARSFCHYSNFLVAEGQNGPGAALSAYDPGEPGLLAPGHAIAAASEEFGSSDAELAEAYRRLEPYQTALPEQRKGVWTIEWVWTVPPMRQRGLVAALIERILDEGRRRGYQQAQVTTFVGNATAARTYEKAGFRVAEEKRHPDFERLMGAPGLVRYECDLAGHGARSNLR